MVVVEEKEKIHNTSSKYFRVVFLKMSSESESKSAESEFHDSNFADEFLEIDYDSPLLDFKHTTLFALISCLYNSDTDSYS